MPSFRKLVIPLRLLVFAATLLGEMVHGQTILVSVPQSQALSVTNMTLTLTILNQGATNLSWRFPARLSARVAPLGAANAISASLELISTPDNLLIVPGTFGQASYRLRLSEMVTGRVVVAFPDFPAQDLVLDVPPSPAPPKLTAREKSLSPEKSSFLGGLIKKVPARPSGEDFEPILFFKEHVFPYEPLYFIAGTESPNAKFEVSFRYQLLNNEGSLADKAPALKGFNVAYTQISLWDWNKASAPFFDSSYKPEFLYRYEGLLGGKTDSWYRLDLQGGVQHESNGKDGDNSRSLNIIYFRPTLTLDLTRQAQLTLIPRAFFYVGDLSDNPDISRYRGYADLRAMLAIRGLQFSALGRLGDGGDRGSFQLDVTYPLMNLWNNFSVYLQAQYFNGYGESLLEYNKRSHAFRVGFSLYR